MNNLIVLPLAIPLGTAILLLFFPNRILLQRIISLAGLLIQAAVSWLIAVQVRQEGIQTLHMSGWVPPYGIVFVADMLAALLVLAASAVSLCCLIYAFGSIGEERERHYFYPLFQFLLVGVNGSFLTGDLFNLFVCFEVMLIASYALIVLGNTRRQLRETLKYMLINIVSSTLFVAGVAYLYGVTGTLNMADLSLRIAESGVTFTLHIIALLFLIVFSLKASLFLFFWVPGAYGAPPAAIAALFASLLTKVGVYALLRSFTLIFYLDEAVLHGWFQGMAVATMVLGALGAVAYRDIRRIMNYNLVISIGFLALGLTVSSKEALEGAAFYLIHDMLAKALLFMLGGWIIQAAGTADLKRMGGWIKRSPLIGGMLFVTALAIAGIPPLSGFLGKLLLIRSGLQEGYSLLAAVALATSLIALYSLLRIFMHAFWGDEKPAGESPVSEKELPAASGLPSGRKLLPAAMLCVLVIGIGLGSEFVYEWVAQAGDVLADPARYIEAVLKG